MPLTLNIALVSLCVLIVALAFSVYLNFKLGVTILRFEDAVEESLDIIDERYRSMSKVLETPIFFDSVEVRQVVNDIGTTRNALLLIANRLSNAGEESSKGSKIAEES